MKDREIANQIASIDKLKMIHFYHLFGENGPMCGILAYYRDQVINLCNTDKHFTELFERLTKVYEREASGGQILTDEKTAEILGRANAFSDDVFEAKLAEYRPEQAPMMLPKAFCSVYIRPIIAYVVESLYGGHDPATVEAGQKKIVFDTRHHDVEALRPVFRPCPLANVAHDGVGDRVPDLADHGDRACQDRVHAESVRQEDKEERVDNNETSAPEDLSHSISQSAEEAVIWFSAADSLFHYFLLLVPRSARKYSLNNCSKLFLILQVDHFLFFSVPAPSRGRETVLLKNSIRGPMKKAVMTVATPTDPKSCG